MFLNGCVKKFIVAASLVSLLFTEVAFADTTVTGIFNVNDNNNHSDYKDENDNYNKSRNDVKTHSSYVENYDVENTTQSLEDLSAAKAWLIENNVLNRHEKFNFTSSGIDFSKVDEKDDALFRKSDLYMMLYKSKFGVIPSRTIVFNTPSVRNGRIVTYLKEYTTNTGVYLQDVYFNEGDYHLYQAPNVYELYFSELLNKGILSSSEFNTGAGATFLSDYKKLASSKTAASYPIWYNKRGNASGSTSGALGASHTYSSNATLSYKTVDYFKNENMYTLEALRAIEDFMRVTEKDMTELESSIVTYKYGIQYLDNLSDSDKKTVSFLIAKGILDYENDDILNLYGMLTNEMAYKLLYRVANTEARLDFSKITLTDSEAYWQSKGFGAEEVNVVSSEYAPDVRTLSKAEYEAVIKADTGSSTAPSIDTDVDEDVDTDTDNDNNFLDDILSKLFNPITVNAATKSKKFTVIKLFDSNYQYTYDGKEVSSMTQGGEVASIKTVNQTNASGKTVKMYVVTFKVNARDYSSAVLYVDSKIKLDSTNLDKAVVQGVTRVGTDGKEITLIPASTLKSTNSNISIIEDKVLLNTKTGTMAVLLPEKGYALVGNKVIVSDDLIDLNNEQDVYYNLEVICSLMSNAYVKKIAGEKSIYFCSSMIGQNQVLAPVIGTTGQKIASAMRAQFNVSDINKNSKGKANLINLDGLSKGINTLTRTFSVKNTSNKLTDVTIIVDWVYAVPSREDFATGNVVDKVTKNKMTINDVNDYFYTRPDDSCPELQNWWDSNLSMSNTLANFMYGTKNVEYITSGWMAPSLTVLKGKNVNDSVLNKLYADYGLQLDDNGKTMCGSRDNFWENYFENSYGSTDFNKSLASKYRKYTELTAKIVNGGESYSSQYFVTDANVIYKNLDNESRLEYKSGKIYVKTREENLNSLPTGTVFNYNGKEWLYLNTDEKGQLVILPNFEVDESYFIKDGFATIVTIDKIKTVIATKLYFNDNKGIATTGTLTSYKNNLKRLYNLYFPGEYNKANYSKVSDIFGLSEDLTAVDKNAYYLYNNSVASIKDGILKVIPRSDIAKTVGKSTTKGIPKFFVKAENYSFYFKDGTAHMVKGSNASILNTGNVYTSGINQTMMDNIIAQYTQTVDMNELEVGSKVYLGDVFLVAKTDSSGNKVFNSYPIKSKSTVNSVKAAKTSKSVTSAIKSLFKGQVLQYSGNYYYLTSYMKKATLGPLTGQGTIIEGILYQRNKNKIIRTNSKDSTSMSTSANYLCIQLTMKDGVLVRPISANKNVYTLVYTGGATGNTTYDEIPFFTESLSYRKGDDADLSLNDSAYNNNQFFRAVKKDFKDMMKEAFKGDLISLFEFFAFSLAGYLAVISWIMYAILTRDIGRKAFEAITVYVRGVGRRGFDLIKLFSLGIYNIDSRPTMSRTIAITLICFFINYSILVYVR